MTRVARPKEEIRHVDTLCDMLGSANNDNMENVVSAVVDFCASLAAGDAAGLAHNDAALVHARRHFCLLECRLEKIKARQLIGLRANLESYFFCGDYRALVANEWDLVQGHAVSLDLEPRALRLAFLGSGAMPVSPLLFSRQVDAAVTCVDSDGEANALARRFIASQGEETRLRIEKGLAQDFDYSGTDIVFMASLISPKRDVLERIAAFDVKAVLARTVRGGFGMIYEAVEPELVEECGFRIVASTPVSEKCMHQTLLLAR